MGIIFNIHTLPDIANELFIVLIWNHAFKPVYPHNASLKKSFSVLTIVFVNDKKKLIKDCKPQKKFGL